MNECAKNAIVNIWSIAVVIMTAIVLASALFGAARYFWLRAW